MTSSPTWPTLETFVRQHVPQCLQQVLEKEVEALLGRPKSARSTDETPAGYRNGHGKPRQLGLMNGTITLRGLLGDGVPLSASADQRLTLDWQRQYAAWKTRNLSTCDLV